MPDQRKIDPISAALALLAVKGGELAGHLPLGALLRHGSHAKPALEDQKARSSDHQKMRRVFEKLYETTVQKKRQPTSFQPLEAYARPDKQEIAVSPRAATPILAHELGHVSNYLQGQKTLPGRALQRMTDASYSPLYPGASIAGSTGYALEGSDLASGVAPGLLEGMGHAGTAGAGILGGLQLMEEARASLKARKAMKQLRGEHYTAKENLPLLGGLGTYGLAAGSAVGLPLLIHHLSG